MIIIKKYYNVLFLMCTFLSTTIHAGLEEKGVKEPVTDEDSYFLVPYNEEDDENNIATFYIRKRQYLIINYQVNYHFAKLQCRYRFHGMLANLRDKIIADSLAEALSETNIKADSLWIGNIQKNDTEAWKMEKKKTTDFRSEKVIQATKTNQTCIALGRLNHNNPQIRLLSCTVFRGYICERPSMDGDDSLHPGWIHLGERLYKIFKERIPYNQAAARCHQVDPKADAAMIINFKDAQALGRYLLIGRPTLENAWIGARWSNSNFRFKAENITLANETDSTGYPPWRYQRIRKPAGCLLLDRHLDDITYFVEERCSRYRPYICYKNIENETDSDVIIIDDRGYAIVLLQKTWYEAVQHCLTHYKNARLVEIDTEQIIYDLLYVMGQNKTALQHIWIGGKYKNRKWKWQSDNSDINMEYLHVINNETYPYFIYTVDVESGYTCLNMDRENHMRALYYGTICKAKQSFVCQFNGTIVTTTSSTPETTTTTLPTTSSITTISTTKTLPPTSSTTSTTSKSSTSSTTSISATTITSLPTTTVSTTETPQPISSTVTTTSTTTVTSTSRTTSTTSTTPATAISSTSTTSTTPATTTSSTIETIEISTGGLDTSTTTEWPLQFKRDRNSSRGAVNTNPDNIKYSYLN